MNPTIVQDATGATSSIRVALVAALVLGSLVILASIIGFFCGLKDSAIFAGCGTTLISIAMGAKSWQAQAESRMPINKE